MRGNPLYTAYCTGSAPNPTAPARILRSCAATLRSASPNRASSRAATWARSVRSWRQSTPSAGCRGRSAVTRCDAPNARRCAAGIAHAELRRLYGAIYAAFRRHRSLLLLNLQHQVRLEELLWVAAINVFHADDLHVREQARQTLDQVVMLALTAFPQQILPNKLLQEFRALADATGLRLPIVI